MMKRKARRTTDVVSFECDISQTSSAVSAASEFGRRMFLLLLLHQLLFVPLSIPGDLRFEGWYSDTTSYTEASSSNCSLSTGHLPADLPPILDSSWLVVRQLATISAGHLLRTPRVGDPSSTKRRPGAGGESADMAAGTVVTYHINSNEDSPSTSSSPSEQRKTQPEEPAEENAAAGGESRERWVLMTMSTLLLLIGCSLFAMLFWLLSEDLVAIPTETIDSPTKLSSEAPTARDPVYRLLRTSVWRKWCEL
ncbi:uncharacterized protein LOC144121684 isoform X4 [Amblyomma americanum]